MIYVTAVHLVGGTRHEHIAQVRWANPQTNETGQSSREAMVTWISGGGSAYVWDGTRGVQVGVVRAVPPYIRTYADGVWTDNLLALQRY